MYTLVSPNSSAFNDVLEVKRGVFENVDVPFS
jgi:hypothetical protein